MKVTKENKEYIIEWLGYADEQKHIDDKVKKLHCPYALANRNLLPSGLICIKCRTAFHPNTLSTLSGCPCKILGVKAVKKRARELLKLEEI